jgi:hypothetical protein
MPGCPECGGVERSPIAPGYWECTCLVTEYATDMRPTPGAPPNLGMMSPVSIPFQRRCGRRYHENVSSSEVIVELCSCGTGMIGRCANDNRPVCGDHSRLRGSKRLCDSCVAEHDTRVAEERRAKLWSDLRSRVDVSLGSLDGLRIIDDDATRALLLQHSFDTRHRATPAAWHRDAAPVLGTELQQYIRESYASARDRLFSASVGEGWDLSSRDPRLWKLDATALVPAWDRDGRLVAPVVIKVAEMRRGLLGGYKAATIGRTAGWLIATGSFGSSGTYGTPGSPDVYVLRDGTTASVGHTSKKLHVNRDETRNNFPVAKATHLISLQQRGYLRVGVPSGLLTTLTSFDASKRA